MRAVFGTERELCREVFYKETENDTGEFHFHSQIEICMVEEGQSRVLINGEQEILRKGDVSVALSFASHFYEPVGYSKTCVLIIPLHMCEEFTAFMQTKKNLCPFIKDIEASRRIKEYFDKIKNERPNQITLRGYLYTVLGIIVDSLQFQTVPASPQAPDAKMLEYIHAHYKSDLTVAAVAAEFGYNPAYLSRYFKTRFNVGLKKYITLLKLKKAVSLMHGGESITDCAFESGFSSLRTFYSAFRSEFYCSPGEYMEHTDK